MWQQVFLGIMFLPRINYYSQLLIISKQVFLPLENIVMYQEFKESEKLSDKVKYCQLRRKVVTTSSKRSYFNNFFLSFFLSFLSFLASML